MVLTLVDPLLAYWPVAAALLVAAGYALGRRRRSWRRHAAMLGLVLLAPILLALAGLVSGCAFRPGGAHCYWYGFGLTVALLLIVPASAVLLAIGAFAARWPRSS